MIGRAAWVEVDLGALVSNALALEALAGESCIFAAVVKADAYGHGIEAASLAARAAGAGYLAVATLDEALRLRAVGDGGLLMLNYPLPADALPEAAAAGIEVTVGSDADVEALGALANRAPEVHVEVDSGMGRGGFWPQRVADAVGRLRDRSVPVRALWTHLASPDDPARTASQVAVFEQASDRLRELGIHPALRHLAASGGLLCGAPRYELVRVGLALYGLDPFPNASTPRLDRPLTPALSVRARAVRIENALRGTPVGYDGTWVTERPSRIATLPIGYVDSWSRVAGTRTHVLVRGARAPVVGRISSDSMTVDVTDVPGVDGDDVFVLLGRDDDESITAEEVAATRDTITWEVLQTLSSRLARIYTLGGSEVAQRSPATQRLVAEIDLDVALARTASEMRRAMVG